MIGFAHGPRLVPPSAGFLGVAPLLLRSVRRTPLVVSFPKAGRTWLRVMLDRLGVAAEYTHFGAGVVRGHLAEEIAPRAWWISRRPTLLLLRDPRDTVVSAFHQAASRRRRYAGTLHEFVRDPRFGIQKVARWNLAWAEFAAGRSEISIVSYEALRAQGVPLLAACARALGRSAPSEGLEEAWSHAAFGKMKERERTGAIEARYRRILGATHPADEASFKVRRGAIGGFRDELAADDVAYCDASLGALDYFARIERALESRGVRAQA